MKRFFVKAIEATDNAVLYDYYAKIKADTESLKARQGKRNR